MKEITLRDFLALAAEKAGMKEEKELLEYLEDAQNQEILAKPITPKAKDVLSRLMNGEQAINDSSIRNRLINEALTPVDQTLKDALKSNGFSDAEINDIFSGKKTAERANVVIKQIVERAQKAIGTDVSEKAQSLKQKAELLEKEMERIAMEKASIEQRYSTEIKEIKKERALERFLSRYKIDDALLADPDIDAFEVKKMKLNAALKKSGYNLQYDEDGGFELLKVGENGAKIKPFNDLNGKPITAEEWVEGTLASLKPKAEVAPVQNAAIPVSQALPDKKKNTFAAELEKLGLK